MGEIKIGGSLSGNIWNTTTPIVSYDLKDEEIKKLKRALEWAKEEKERIEAEIAKKEQEKTKIELPEKYIINENATILFWKDKTKTIVKRCENDKFNPRLGFLTAFFQHYCGMSKNKANKYLAKLEIESPKEEK